VYLARAHGYPKDNLAASCSVVILFAKEKKEESVHG